MNKKILRDESTPAGKKIWAAVDRAAAKAPKVVRDRLMGLDLTALLDRIDKTDYGYQP
jgi:hypothetical protein